MVEGREETEIAVVWVNDEMDRCRVGLLPRHMVKHAACYDGSLAQVNRVFSLDQTCCNLAERRMHHHNTGCCLARIISCLPVVSCMTSEGGDNGKIGKEMTKKKRVV